MQTSIHPTAATPSAVVIGADEDAAYRTMSMLVDRRPGARARCATRDVRPAADGDSHRGHRSWRLLAIRRIALSEGTLIGRTAALIGLALSIASISAAFTRTELTQAIAVAAGPRDGTRVVCTPAGRRSGQAHQLMSPVGKARHRSRSGRAAWRCIRKLIPRRSSRCVPIRSSHFLLDHAAGSAR